MHTGAQGGKKVTRRSVAGQANGLKAPQAPLPGSSKRQPYLKLLAPAQGMVAATITLGALGPGRR